VTIGIKATETRKTVGRRECELVQRTKQVGADRGALHPNAQKLVDSVLALMEDTPVESLSLVMVLQHSGLSNGSLYHHFEDFQDLVEHAVVVRFTRGLNESHSAIERLLDLTDEKEFRSEVERIVFAFHDQGRRPLRMARLETLGALTSRPRLAERIGRAQFESNMKQAGYLAELQERGWFRRDLDPVAISTFMTATFLGRVVDDIASEHLDPSEWSRVAWVAFKAILFPE
jgi:AcrR family transcriptional regulator